MFFVPDQMSNIFILMVYRFTVFLVDIHMPVTVPFFYSFINDHPVCT